MRVQGDYGRRTTVREHTTPRVKTPINAVYRSGKGDIMTERALLCEWCNQGPQYKIGPFCVDPPWAELPFTGSFAREYHSFIAGAPQLRACPLTQCYGEWKLSCVLTKMLKRGYSLQFCSIPPPFKGMQEVNLSSQEEMGFLSAEIQALVQKQAVSIVHPRHREQGLYSTHFLVPKKTG